MKTNKRFSLITFCILYFTLCASLILLIFLVSTLISNKVLNDSFPVIADIIEYDDYLKNDEFNKIPIKKIFGSDFAVYNGDKSLLYSSVTSISVAIKSEDDLDFINDYSSDSYYSVLKLKDKNNNEIIKIYEYTYDSEDDLESITGYAKLNSDYEIVEGDLFASKKVITKDQIDLIEGEYIDSRVIEKYSYKNNADEDRILLFISPDFNLKNYDKALAKSRKIWFVSIPIIIIIMCLSVYLFSKKIKRCLNILNDEISNYKDGNKLSTNSNKLPKEFQKIAQSFDELMVCLKKSEEERFKMYEEKQRLIADISHDLKTPLTVIQGYSKAFIDNIVPSSKKDEYIKSIYNKSVIACELIDRLFDYIRLEHPDFTLPKEKVDICEISKEYLDEKYNEITEKKMELIVDIPDDKIMANISVFSIRRVYENLINNSLKYNKAKTKIYFKLSDDNEYVSIIIADNGCGVPKEIRDSLFDAFVTSNDARTSGKGNGLGMAIAKKIVLLHDGEITLSNNPLKGYKTEFDIKIKK